MKIRGDFRFDALKLLAAFGIYQRNNHFKIRIGLAKNLRCFEKIGAQHLNFCATAAWQQCQTVRTDVVNRFDTLLFQIPFEGNVEIRRIDTDKHIGFEFGKAAGEIGTDVQQTA